jgi:hypothetical protein
MTFVTIFSEDYFEVNNISVAQNLTNLKATGPDRVEQIFAT